MYRVMILANANSPLVEKWLQMDRSRFEIIFGNVKSILTLLKTQIAISGTINAVPIKILN